MFDFVRKHTKILMAVMFMLIIPSFVVLGVSGYDSSRDTGATVAKVDGVKITQTEWDRAHLAESERMRASMPTVDAKLLDSPAARYSTLERLVRDRVVAVAADKLKLATSDQRLARELQQSPEIASLREPDGKLDMVRYRQLLGSQNLSPEMFEANVRSDLSRRQVLAGIGGSGFSSQVSADLALNALFEKREIQVARFNSTDFAAKLNPTDAELEQFYKANEKLFQAPELASIEYVQLDLNTVTKGINIADADLKTYYEQNVQRLSGGEERRASHILITAPKTASAVEREKAKSKASELLAAVTKAPDTFAEVARKNSQDPGSAANGGDLDFFARGAMVKPFEDAAFSMKKGDISTVVESDFGFHIIKLTDVKSPKQRSFEEMRPEIEANLKKQQAQKLFSEQAEIFTNMVYEQAESLKFVAERLKLEIKTVANITRQPAPGVVGALGNAKFLTALFAPDAAEKKRNTEATEVAPSTLVSGRIVQYTPARTQPFAEVKLNVRQRWTAQRSAEEAKKEGEAKLAAWKAAPASAVFPASVVVSRDQTQQQPAAVIDAALRADISGLPAAPVLTGVDLGSQGYAVLKVDKVLPRDVQPAAASLQARQQYAQAWTAAESLAYYNTLKDRFKTEILVPRPA
ncbi:MAG: SurA N-terminal domain-containing protein, partial [Polaromonas sp.]|nr:SurA N-terminal domain-containing protein [Polaromonas sp.]